MPFDPKNAIPVFDRESAVEVPEEEDHSYDASEYEPIPNRGQTGADLGIPGSENVVSPKLRRKRGLKEKLIGGAEVAASLLSSVPAAMGGALTIPNTALGNLASGSHRDPEKEAGEFMQRNTYRPRTEAGQDYLGDTAQALDDSKVEGIGPMGEEVRVAMGAAKPLTNVLTGKVAQAVEPEAHAIGQAVDKFKAGRAAKAATKSSASEARRPVIENANLMEELGMKASPQALSGG